MLVHEAGQIRAHLHFIVRLGEDEKGQPSF